MVVVVLIEILRSTPLKFAASAPILILAVVCATFLGGLVDGLLAAGIVVWYYAYDLSSTGTAFPYTHETVRRVLVFACSAPAVALMVGLLKQRAARITAEAARKERESADAVYTSLTWTREAERFGREAERRFRAFFDTSEVGVMHTLRERRLVEFGETKAEGRSAYVVRDDGAGFDRAYAGPLPGAIQRLRSADAWLGAGLALAMVQRIVQRHGDRIWCEGSPEGAVFYFTLGEAPGPPAASA